MHLMSDEREFEGFYTQTALAQALSNLFIQLEARLKLETPLTVYLAGGMAVHLYTGERVTTDVDAEFAGRLVIPQDLVIDVEYEDGSIRALYFDVNYNPMFALMHENYQDDSLALDIGTTDFNVRVLSPLDLAVSKLARFAANDREPECCINSAVKLDAAFATRSDNSRLIPPLPDCLALNGSEFLEAEADDQLVV